MKNTKTITVKYADGRTIEAPRYGKVLNRDVFVTEGQKQELYDVNSKAEVRLDYIERAKVIQDKINTAEVNNRAYYKSLQAIEDKKWADIKLERKSRRNKRGRK